MPASTVLVVDDNPDNLAVLGETLSPLARVRTALDGPRALRLAAQAPQPDLILLDVMMPGMDGHAVLQRLRAMPQTRDIPVIFVTALADAAHEERGLQLGAVDYLAKPLRLPVVLARVQMHLAMARARRGLLQARQALEVELQRQRQDNQLAQDATLHALTRLAETRDDDTGRHLLRTQAYVRRLAQRLAAQPAFADQLGEDRIAAIVKAAPLHDIGKVGIPDEVLRKPGRLDADERRVMQNHAALGAATLERAERDLQQSLPFLADAKCIARHHHERWDGTGYPDRLAGEAIPLPARLMAMADVFDALSTPRVYRQPLSFSALRRHFIAERGRQFDPRLVDAFLADYEAYCDIARSLADDAPA
ncbi:HD-GYP domain-containing protein [Aquabacterium sp.]|uniref:HD-GYP domain-containing protein n=1 Tax=Aquabacterium sp. TaxID=1872578 RepID=UPI003782D432